MRAVIIFILVFFSSQLKALNGPSVVNKSSEQTYSHDNGAMYLVPIWEATNGTVTDSWRVGTEYYVKVLWSNSANTGEVRFINWQTLVSSKSITILHPPNTPPNPSISANTCGDKTLTRQASPPSGVKWYWQNSATGTSTSIGHGTDRIVSNSGTYYLRAKNDNGGFWSSGAGSASVSINNIPNQPPVPTINLECGAAELTRASPSSGITYYWQSSANTTDISNSSLKNTVYSEGTYYLRSRNSAGCWGPSSSVNIILIAPTPPGTDILGDRIATIGYTREYSYDGGNTITGATWSADGGTVLSTSVSSTDYRAVIRWDDVRPDGIVTLCNSTGHIIKQVNAIEVIDIPLAPADPLASSNNCGTGNLTRQGSPPPGVKWYWQHSSNGTNTTLGYGSTYTVTTSGTYYLRAVNDIDPAWSSGVGQATITINDIPQSPAMPEIQYECGTAYLYKASNTLTNEYWQTNPAGTDVSNNDLVYETSVSGTYYIRKVSSAGCWSQATEIEVLLTTHSGGLRNISGKIKPVEGSIQTYSVNNGGGLIAPQWSVQGGEIISEELSTPQYTIWVQWGICGEGYVSLCTYGRLYGEKHITISPPAPYVDEISCGEVILTREGNPYEGTQWYWQTEENGTREDLGTANTITVLNSGDFYLRSRKNDGTWGNSSLPLFVPDMNVDINYVRTFTMLKPFENTQEANIDIDASSEDTRINTNYVDGLGRVFQTVQKQLSPAANDLVSFIEFDLAGRPYKEYLPYVKYNSINGNYKECPKVDQLEFYNNPDLSTASVSYSIAQTLVPYSEKKYEPSPLNRVEEQSAPGEAWAMGTEKTITSQFDVYSSTEDTPVVFWKVENEKLEYSGTYATGELTKTTITDANGHQVIEFTNQLGQTILKRAQAPNSGWADTYYVYDVYQDLVFVLPPECSNRIGHPSFVWTLGGKTLIDNLGFQYKYDGRKRMISKKVPGAEIVYLVYNNANLLVMTQDGKQRINGNNEWLFTKYDQLGRPVLTGIIDKGSDQLSDIRSQVASAVVLYEERAMDVHGYSNDSYPSVSNANDYLTVTYYDDYDFPHAGNYSFIPDLELNQTEEFDRVKGQVTGAKVKTLDGSNTWLKSVTYYDDEYRVIQQHNQHLLGNVINTNQYGFLGQLLKTKTTHSDGTDTYVIKKRFEYDHADRLLEVWNEIDNTGEILLTQNTYNELGELIDKGLHSTDNGTTFAQSVDYRYNIRSWLNKINDNDLSDGEGDYFGMMLGYNEDIGLSIPSADLQFDGNISAVSWSEGLDNTTTTVGYSYQYDPMNRIKKAQSYNMNTDAFNLDAVSYDLNGNIESLTRMDKAGIAMDILTYDYGTALNRGNKLLSVKDDGNDDHGFKDGHDHESNSNNDYDYDDNGNLTQDLNKGITGIAYNHLNLPTRVEKNVNNYILYTYDATGTKLQQKVYEAGVLTKTTHYAGEFIYESPNEDLEIIKNKGDDMTSITTFLSSLSTTQLNGEPYLKVDSDETVSTPSVTVATLTVVEGETYEFRLKGYHDGTHTPYLRVKGNTGFIVTMGTGSTTIEKGIVNDKWYSATFEIPNGVTELTLGVGWNNSLDGVDFDDVMFIDEYIVKQEDPILSLVQHEEGRIVPDETEGDWDYEYYLKDHLGNTRVVFTTDPKTINFTLNYESDPNNPDDEGLFDNLDNIIAANIHDHTDAGSTYDQSQLLNGATGGVVGSVLTIPVGQGDKIDASVYAKYLAPTGTSNPTAAVGSLIMNAITGSVGVNNYEGAINNSFGTSGSMVSGVFGDQIDDNVPRAYINLLFLPDDVGASIANNHFAFAQLSTASSNNHALLELAETFEAPKSGYVVVYLSNESLNLTEVYFDDLTVTVNEHPVIEKTDYYPFGLAHSGGYQRVTAKENRFKFNGKELIEDLDLGLYDYGWRMYDPTIGRWNSVDPLADQRDTYTPYNFVRNNPLIFIDPDGLIDDYVFDKNGNFTGEIRETGDENHRIVVQGEGGNETTYNLNDPENDSKNLENVTSTYGTDTKIVYQKSAEDIAGYMDESGVTSQEARDSEWSFAYEESTGSMDFWANSLAGESENGGISTSDLASEEATSFYIFEGNNKAYNTSDAGNYLWGGAMKNLGFRKGTAKTGAHINNALFGGKGTGIRDSKGDQRAISDGYDNIKVYPTKKK